MESKVITITEQGGPQVMRLQTVQVGAPAATEVTVRQTAIGVNFIDVYHRSGHYPMAMPSGIGVEAVGVAMATGEAVTGISVGQRVAYAGGVAPGAYAEARNVPAARLVAVPDGVSDEDAAAVLFKGMTVEYLLERTYPVQAGQWVLFYAAAGGVGRIAGQWGKALGARMIGVTSSPEKCQLALARGYEAAIDRNTEDVVARVKQLTDGAGVPVAYDSVGQSTFSQTLDCLARRGYFVSFGAASGPPPAVEAGALQKHGSLYFTRPSIADYGATRDELVASADAVFAMLAKGAITADIGQRYALADAAQAHIDLESAKTTGSAILLP